MASNTPVSQGKEHLGPEVGGGEYITDSLQDLDFVGYIFRKQNRLPLYLPTHAHFHTTTICPLYFCLGERDLGNPRLTKHVLQWLLQKYGGGKKAIFNY